MDLSKFDTVKAATQGAFLHLEFDGKLLYDEKTHEPVGLFCLGSDSQAYQNSKHKQQDSRIGRARIGRGGRMKNIKAEETDYEALQLVAGVVTGLRCIESSGVPLEFSYDNVVALFERFPWILEQADEFIHDRSNFRIGAD